MHRSSEIQVERSNELDEICDAEVKTELSDSFIESFEKGSRESSVPILVACY